jgi:hypothetical protein
VKSEIKEKSRSLETLKSRNFKFAVGKQPFGSNPEFMGVIGDSLIVAGDHPLYGPCQNDLHKSVVKSFRTQAIWY